MNRREKIGVFAIGAAGYPIIELLYRKRTHWSMAVAGGVCFSLIYRIHGTKRPLLLRCAMGAAAVTCVEFVTGLVVNRLFKLGVWDYSKKRFNLLGQVCPKYTGMWFALCAALSPVCKGIRAVYRRKKR